MPKAMTPDAIRNMIRRMLVEEGWVKREAVTDAGFPDGTLVHRIKIDTESPLTAAELAEVRESEGAYWRDIKVADPVHWTVDWTPPVVAAFQARTHPSAVVIRDIAREHTPQ